jgi:hypothetical protein
MQIILFLMMKFCLGAFLGVHLVESHIERSMAFLLADVFGKVLGCVNSAGSDYQLNYYFPSRQKIKDEACN